MATDTPQATVERLQTLIVERCGAAGADRSVSPDEVARAAGGDPHDTVTWRPLLRAVRAAAATLQDRDEIRVLRKGKPADIRTVKVVIRFALPDGTASPPGD